MVAGLIMLDAISETVARYISKSGRSSADTLLEAYQQSRGILIDPMLANIADDPWRGIGFGIASNPSEMVVQRDPFLGLPIGSSIEKGVAPLAIVEEVGVLGAILIIFWLLVFLRKGVVAGLPPLAVLLTALILNLGEYTLFSAGGQGLLLMILFGWVYGSAARRGQHE